MPIREFKTLLTALWGVVSVYDVLCVRTNFIRMLQKGDYPRLRASVVEFKGTYHCSSVSFIIWVRIMELFDVNSILKRLESVHHYCLKRMQGLHMRTRSDMVLRCLGMLSIEEIIDKQKLRFFGSLCRLPNRTAVKQLFLIRTFQDYYKCSSGSDGFIHNIKDIMAKYGFVYDFDHINFPELFPKCLWKRMISDAVSNKHKNDWSQRMSESNDFQRFSAIHRNLEPALWWIICRLNLKLKNACSLVIKLCCSLPYNNIQCNKCMSENVDIVKHVLVDCNVESVRTTRDKYWNSIMDDFGVRFFVSLDNMDEDVLTTTLLGDNRQTLLERLQDSDLETFNVLTCVHLGTPVTSVVQIYIISVDSISDATMDYSMSIFLRQRWKDPRLQYTALPEKKFIELDTTVMDSVWIPDLYILNEKQASHHDVTVPNKLMHVYPDGLIVYSARVSGTFSCSMLLHKYPLDTQKCSFIMESYGYSVDSLLFRWNDLPVERSPILSLPQFELGKITSYICDKEYAGVNYTCIGLDFELARNYGYYMIQVYVPSFLTVLLSWVSFWIDIDATPARTSLGLLTVLTITTQSSSSQTVLPRVSYIKAIDVWDAVCLFFVFAAFIEYAWVNVLARVAQRKKAITTDSKLSLELEENGNTVKQNDLNAKRKGINHLKELARREKARTVDKISRVIFPLSFVIFNVGYWLFYIFWEPH